MKKIFFALVLLLSTAFSQQAQAQLLDFDGMPPYKLGLSAGFTTPTFSGANYDYTVGLNGGIDLMIDGSDLFDDTFARIQLRYAMKGATGPDPIEHFKSATNEMGDEIYVSAGHPKTHYTTHYIEIPIHYGYAWALDRDWTIMGETGPYVAWGLGGTSRPDDKSYLKSDSFFKRYDASHLDFGWGVQCSLLFDQQWQFHVGYDWGFKNMTETFLQNNGLNIGLTLYFEY